MADLFARKPRLTVLAIGLILVAGLGALQTLPRQEDPTLARRFGTITTAYPGASALRVESLVTEPIESRLQELHEIEEIDSVSRTGISLIQVELEDAYDEEDVDEIWSKLRDEIADAQSVLPPGAAAPIFEDQTSTALTLLVAFNWERDDAPALGLLTRLAEELEQRLRNVPRTKETRLYGEAEEEVRVEVDPASLASLGLTTSDVAQALALADAKQPAGALRGAATDMQIEVQGEIDTLARVRAVPIRQQGDGGSLRVADVARVEKGVREPPASIAWLGGRRGVAVGATMETNHRVDQWATDARAVVEAFRSEVPAGVGYEVIFDQSRYTEARLGGLVRNLLGAGALVVAVLFFMMGVRSAVLVALSLPLTFGMSLAGLSILGVPLHQTSITGLIVAIGILIDNAIVSVDKFRGKLVAGATPLEAAGQTARWLVVPLFASTVTTALAFLPIVLMPGGAGEFVGPISIGVCLAVGSSFLLAITIVPALCAWFPPKHLPGSGERVDWRDHGFSSPALTSRFRASLAVAVRRPWIGVGAALLLPLLGFALGRTLPEQFFPANDRNQFQVQLVLPSEASIEETLANVQRARAIVNAHADVVESHWVIGETPPRVFYNMFGNQDGVPSFAGGFVTTHSAEATQALLPGLQEALVAAFPNARVLALPFEQGPPFEAPIELRLVGPDLEVLRGLGDSLRETLAETHGVTFSTARLAGGEPKLLFETDEAAARLAGLRLTEIAGQLQDRLEGAVGGSLLEANQELPVRVRVAGAERATPGRIGAGRVLARDRAALPPGDALMGVPLAALGDVRLVPELSGITRRNGERINTVQAFLEPYRLISDSLADFQHRHAASDFVLPTGYRLEIGGESEQRNEALGRLVAFAIPLFVVMAGTIVLSFDSFRMAGIIFGVALLSVGLGQLGVWVFGHPMGFIAIVGTMGLVGIAINDSILVLSALRRDPRASAGDLDATLDVVTGSARHVVATTLTTIGGFVPLLVWGGRFWPPLAAAIVVGVAGATIVALYFVPAMHAWIVRTRLPARAHAPAPAPAPIRAASAPAGSGSAG